MKIIKHPHWKDNKQLQTIAFIGKLSEGEIKVSKFDEALDNGAKAEKNRQELQKAKDLRSDARKLRQDLQKIKPIGDSQYSDFDARIKSAIKHAIEVEDLLVEYFI